jgi:hypothetical protein
MFDRKVVGSAKYQPCMQQQQQQPEEMGLSVTDVARD